jgi:hypothetical protein
MFILRMVIAGGVGSCLVVKLLGRKTHFGWNSGGNSLWMEFWRTEPREFVMILDEWFRDWRKWLEPPYNTCGHFLTAK